MKGLYDIVSLEGKINIKHGYAFKGEYFSTEGDYILLTPGNIYPDGGFKLDEPKEKYYKGDFPKSFLFEKNDLVTVMTDLTQEAIILGGAFIVPTSNKFLHNQRLGKIVILDDKEIDKKFLYYCFNFEFFRGQVRGSASGTTVKHTAPERIYKCKIPLPPLPAQQRIASILSAYDDLIEVNNQRIKLLEQTARELYKEWFVRMRFPGYKQAKFKKGVPEGWEEKKIGDIILIKNGKQAVLQENGFFKVFGSNGEIGFSDNYNYEHVLVIGRVGAYCGSIEIAKEKIWATDNTLVALPKFETVGYYYSYYYLETLDLGNFATGSAQPLLTQSIIKRLELKIPPRDLVNSFESIVETMFDQIEILQQQNTQLRQIRDRLLPRLVSGKLKVSGSEFSELKNEQNQFKKNEQN